MRQLGPTVYKPDNAFHGYTLFAPMRGTSAYLIDMRGAIVHRGSFRTVPPTTAISSTTAVSW